jgi:hypothetical protein
MKIEQIDEIEKRLETLPRIELEYFRNWLMNHYPILALAHDIGTIISTMDDVGAEYNEIDDLLKTIKDHSKWEIEESYFLEEERNGYYKMIELEIEVDKLTKKEYEHLIELLNKYFPGYVDSPSFRNYVIGSSRKEGDPTVDDIFNLLEKIEKEIE